MIGRHGPDSLGDVRKRERRLKRQRAHRESRKATQAAREFADPRGLSVQITAQGGIPVTEESYIFAIEPIRLDGGAELWFQSPHVPPFYLLTAKMFRDRAEPKRVAAVTATTETPDGTLRPLNAKGAFDAIEGLAISVILAAAAIEAHANDMISRLDEAAQITVTRRGMAHVYERDSMERSLGLEEKLDLVGPLFTGRPSIKGTSPWEAYRRVVDLRNELVHPKREAVPKYDPDDPSPYGLLMRGKGSRAPEDAATVIEAIEPGWIPNRIRGELGLPPRGS